MTATELGRNAGRDFWANWEGPNGDGSLGALSLGFVEDGPAADAAWAMPEPLRSNADRRAEFVRGFLAAR